MKFILFDSRSRFEEVALQKNLESSWHLRGHLHSYLRVSALTPRTHNRYQRSPPYPKKWNERAQARERNSRKRFEVAFQRGSLLAVSPRRVTFAERE